MREHGSKHMLRIMGLPKALNLTSPVGNAMHCSLDCHKFIGITTNASVFAQGLVSNLITAGHGREAAFAAAVLGDNALMEKAWQDTGMLAEAVLHAQVSSFEFSHAQSYFMSCKPLWFCVITLFLVFPFPSILCCYCIIRFFIYFTEIIYTLYDFDVLTGLMNSLGPWSSIIKELGYNVEQDATEGTGSHTNCKNRCGRSILGFS
jgi:hypothetical protein